MSLRAPNRLKEGDLVALVGPASPMKTDAMADRCATVVESLGLRVKRYPSSRQRYDYLAGTDRQRSADLNRAFADERIKGIFCIRGGYGSSRLLPLVDWKAAGKSGKPFVGFSDITSLIGALNTARGATAIHGPTPSYFLEKDKPGERSLAALRDMLFNGYKGLSYREWCGKDFKPRAARKGIAKGRLVGGNLSLLGGLVGTPWMPKPKRGESLVLFIEEIHEQPYKLDRYLTQIILSGWMDHIAGIAVGGIDDCKPKTPDKLTGPQVVERCLKDYKVPLLFGLPVGHCRPSYALPIGSDVELDANKGDLRVIG